MKILKVFFVLLTFTPHLASARQAYNFVDNEIQKFMEQNNIPAVSVGIIEEGSIKYKRAYGVFNRKSTTPITSDSFFQIGSQTKVITSILTLALINEGKLKIDNNLNELLPNHFTSIDDKTLKTITIDSLLSHRSGLPNYPENVKRVDGDPMLGGYSDVQFKSALKTLTIEHQPNSKFSYSNFNYAILGYILSQKTGKSYGELVSNYLNGQLGISSIYNDLNSKQSENMVTPYRKDDRDLATKPWEMGLLTPHGGLYSSVDGLLQLMKLQLSAYKDDTQSGQISPLISTQASYETGFYPGLNYGYGMFEATPELGLYPETVMWHGGDLDGFGCEYVFSPSTQKGIVLLTSSGGKEFVLLGRSIMRTLLETKAN